jgi:hypothetical protein
MSQEVHLSYPQSLWGQRTIVTDSGRNEAYVPLVAGKTRLDSRQKVPVFGHHVAYRWLSVKRNETTACTFALCNVVSRKRSESQALTPVP